MRPTRCYQKPSAKQATTLVSGTKLSANFRAKITKSQNCDCTACKGGWRGVARVFLVHLGPNKFLASLPRSLSSPRADKAKQPRASRNTPRRSRACPPRLFSARLARRGPCTRPSPFCPHLARHGKRAAPAAALVPAEAARRAWGCCRPPGHDPRGADGHEQGEECDSRMVRDRNLPGELVCQARKGQKPLGRVRHSQRKVWYPRHWLHLGLLGHVRYRVGQASAG